MKAYEAKDIIDTALAAIADKIPRYNESAMLDFSCRTYFTNDSLWESEEIIDGHTSALWGEIIFTPRIESPDEEDSLKYYFSVEIEDGEIDDTEESLSQKLLGLSSDFESNLFLPLAECGGDEAAIARVISNKASMDYKKDIENYDKEIKKFYLRMMIVGGVLLAALIPLVILAIKYVFN